MEDRANDSMIVRVEAAPPPPPPPLTNYPSLLRRGRTFERGEEERERERGIGTRS